jgi:hypothetical protein
LLVEQLLQIAIRTETGAALLSGFRIAHPSLSVQGRGVQLFIASVEAMLKLEDAK